MGDDVQTVLVPLGDRACSIHIGRGLLSLGADHLRQLGLPRRGIVVSDENVWPLHGPRLMQPLNAAGFDFDAITVPAGESSKSQEQASRLYDHLAVRRHTRDEPIIALGGGMVGDLAGFVAATWMRGVPLIQCPTTTEAAIDASVGGKTALNHPAGKNLIGAFHQPRTVLVDLDCLATLSDRDFRAGLAESVKHALIADEAFFAWQGAHAQAILSREPAAMAWLIRRNCEIKAAIVAADERETDATSVGRAALNAGHTIGHALELEPALDLRHGEAIALGLSAELDLAVRCIGLADDTRKRVIDLLAGFGLPQRIPADAGLADRIVQRAELDKKNRDGGIHFVLIPRIGEAIRFTGASDAAIAQTLRLIIGPVCD